tara:strand:+ start:1829 stop:2158 length:330 start_codon:yes stop_codon:yes gene_type:complete
MTGGKDQSNWNEYSKLVLKELETLASGIDALSEEMKDLKVSFAALSARESKIDELKVWKEKVDEVVSPAQLKTLVTKVDKHEIFMVRAVTAFTVIQIIMAAAMAALKLL